jgi:MoaA/NifB/PqqE/SkfB family radical SAM enzyme
MPTEDFDRLVEDLKERRVEQVFINGHGETTLLPDWQEKVRKIAYAGLNMSVISNFARLMSDAELEAMAHVGNIQVSIDTHRADLLQKLRRKVDVRNILTNMVRVRAAASRLGIPKPKFSWSCVITDKNAFDLVDYAHFALACGVREVFLCNLTKYDDVDGAINVDHVTTMPQDKLARFAGMIEEARAILSQAGGQLFVIAGLEESIADTLSLRGAA